MMRLLKHSSHLVVRNGLLVLAIAATLPPPVIVDPVPPPPPPGGGGDPGGGGNSSEISLVEFPNQIVVQRLNGVRSIPVAGTVTASIGVPVEARVIDAESNIAVTAWSSVGVTNASTNFSGNILVPQGGWYKLEVRVAGSQTIVKTGTNILGVGAVIGLIGQSNMTNFMSTAYDYPLGYKKSIQFSSTGVYQRLGNTKDSLPPNTISGTPGYPSKNNVGSFCDGPVYLANMLALELGVPVVLVAKPASGSAIKSWTEGTATNWNAFKTMLTAAGGDMEAAIWYQGETDANAATEAYMRNGWNLLLAQCLAITARTVDNFKLGMVSLGPGSYSGSSEGEFGNMRVWQRDYAKSTPGWFYATGAHATSAADGVHIGGKGHAENGRREARSYLHTLGVGESGAGPYITGASVNGNKVTINIRLSGGTMLKDGLGGNGSALTGFQFFDDNVVLPYNATEIVGNTLVVTLVNAPVGQLTMNYGIINCPHSSDLTTSATFVPASVVYDNVAMPNMTYGCPLQPCANFIVG